MKNKKLCSVMLMCALTFGGIGVTQSQISTVHAMPSEEVAAGVWHVYGEKDLRDDLKLVDKRVCPQGREYVKSLINNCICNGKTLEAKEEKIYAYPGWEYLWYYKII